MNNYEKLTQAIKSTSTELLDWTTYEGRKPKACCCCGRTFSNVLSKMYRTASTSQKLAYVCSDCATLYAYGVDLAYHRQSENEERVATGSGFCLGIEAEAMNKGDSLRERIVAAAVYGATATKDCTVGVEYHLPRFLSLNGVKDILDGLQNISDMTPENCGAHAHISTGEGNSFLGESGYYSVRNNSGYALVKLMDYIEENGADIQLFGRHCGNYSRKCSANAFNHGDWLNICDSNIEWRLLKYQNTRQYFDVLNMCIELTKFLTTKDYIGDGGTSRLGAFNPKMKGDTEKQYKAMCRIVRKYLDGKAPCQKASRNFIVSDNERM